MAMAPTEASVKPFFWVNTGAIVFWGGCIFGWVPSVILTAIPLLNRVGHNDVDFSYLLIIHVTIQSACTGSGAWGELETLRQAAGDFACVAGAFAGMVLLYLRRASTYVRAHPRGIISYMPGWEPSERRCYLFF